MLSTAPSKQLYNIPFPPRIRRIISIKRALLLRLTRRRRRIAESRARSKVLELLALEKPRHIPLQRPARPPELCTAASVHGLAAQVGVAHRHAEAAVDGLLVGVAAQRRLQAEVVGRGALAYGTGSAFESYLGVSSPFAAAVEDGAVLCG